MKKPLRVGVVGAGFGARVLLPAFRHNPGCRVMALCVSSQKHAQFVSKKWNVPHAYGNWHKMVSDPDLDAIVIAVPPDLQPAIALKAIRSGKAVFCEKPLSVRMADARRMTVESRRKKVVSVVDFEFPEVPAFKVAKKYLDQKKLGGLRHVNLAWQIETYANAHKLNSWKNKQARGGGALFSFVSHSFYYLEWLFGPIAALNARVRTAPDLKPNQDTLCLMRLFFKQGFYANVTVATHALHGSGHRLEIYGSKGTLRLENGAKDYIDGFKIFYGSRKDSDLKPIRLHLTGPKTADGRIGAVSSLASRFIGAVKNNKPMTPDLQSGLRVQQLIETARLSARSEQWVECQKEK